MGASDPARLIETHVSIVFFVGERAYKLKKAVAPGFLDFSTRSKREAACLREVELNRRLAPDVYLGVATILSPDGSPWDHLVVMRRMPEERRLSALLDGPDAAGALREVAREVAAFHATARRAAEIDRAATRDAVRRLWEDNFSQMHRFATAVFDPADLARAEALVRRYLNGREALFERRIAEGAARDGHGDLLADDIFCLPDGPRILDCIEFDDRLRYGDVLGDVAFLAMDLERLGHPEPAARFLAWYREFSGETYPATLADHYVAYRAHIRAKVAALRHEQGAPEAAGEAARLHETALDHLERSRVELVLVGGLPGTGKTTLAAGLAEARGWTLLRSDEIRKELAGLAPTQRAAAPWGEGIYRPEMTQRTYAETLARADRLLAAGEPVVIDATWSRRSHRETAARIAESTCSDLVEIRCEAPAGVAAARLGARAAQDVSDATPEIARSMAREADPWPGAIVVDSTGSPGAALAQGLAILGRGSSPPGRASREGRRADGHRDDPGR